MEAKQEAKQRQSKGTQECVAGRYAREDDLVKDGLVKDSLVKDGVFKDCVDGLPCTANRLHGPGSRRVPDALPRPAVHGGYQASAG